MSSILGHSLIGAAIASRVDADGRQKLALMAYFAVLSLSPDVDYLVYWIFDYEIEPRYTHSIGFCLFISMIALAFNRLTGLYFLRNIQFVYLVMSPISHLILDFMVGVHKSPFLWPVFNEAFTSEIGVLPSAGRLDIQNYYFWRNLLIEMGILLPICFWFSAAKVSRRWSIATAIALLAVMSVSGYVGFHLQR
ncbi:hypothetical protein BTA51_13640 [Hahella sp. CCB-MM4]|uniref:metal-dependent hydrolase n=1 Tax=Hahella sp. (strain CCB-MM4) TaxID=1926491 RepID=UPI000B9C0A51|nr:metal-dependent hydrolase [Hahella sp. CCB-MM4]OZG72992.1 hypothetical protein BTA51_13640 [Hahella sp. CCB-MM4]